MDREDDRPASAGAGTPPGTYLAELFQRPGYLIRRAHQLNSAMVMEQLAPTGMTATQLALMCALDSPEPLDQAGAARLIGLDRSTTGYVVGTLEARSLVARGDDPADRRRRVITLTDEGREVLKSNMATMAAMPHRTLGVLEEGEAREFLRLLNKLVDGLSAQAETNGAPEAASGRAR